MNEQFTQLEERIKKLEARLTNTGIDNDLGEVIRNVVYFDIDNTASKLTQTATVSGVSVTIGKIPTAYVKGLFRGKVYYFAIYDNP